MTRVLPDSITGEQCGATFIESSFIKWIESHTKNLGITAKDVGTGGHFVLTPQGKTILRRFEALKCQFTGSEDNSLTLPTDVEADADFAQCANGLLSITR